MSYATTVVILLKAQNVIKIVENQMKIQRLSINMLNKWSVAQFQVKLKLSWVYSLQRSAWNKIEAFKSFRCCWSVVGMEVGIKKKKNRKSEIGSRKMEVESRKTLLAFRTCPIQSISFFGRLHEVWSLTLFINDH